MLLCLLIGGALGLWAAHSDRVSAILRPINDTLQTMPQFVFLIPCLMFFKVGEFTALIAIMLYAIVPPIRYVEHGIRNVRPDVVEAARQIGCTPSQLLWQVKLPHGPAGGDAGAEPDHHGRPLHAGHRRHGRHPRSRASRSISRWARPMPGSASSPASPSLLLAMISDRIIRGWCSRRQAPTAR